MLHAAWRIGSRALKSPPLWAIAAAAFVAIYAFGVPFPAIVLAAGVLGALGGRFAPKQFATGGGHQAGEAAHAPAVIDDATPTPEHARFRASRLAAVIVVGSLLWGGTLGALAWAFGVTSELVQMGWFFTKAALLTFGGAYAVLPYVVQGAVETYGGSRAAMIDRPRAPGLPLIMVGRVRRFRRRLDEQIFGPEQLFTPAARRVRRDLVHVPPSFLFILADGRWSVHTASSGSPRR